MSTEILHLSDGRAVLSCDTSGWAFGPVLPSEDAAWAFEKFIGRDPRKLSARELQGEYERFLIYPIVDCARCGEPHADMDGRALCPECRQCEWCQNDDVLITDRGMEGWLCLSCAEGLE